MPWPFEEEVALLGKEQAEARQVDLLQVFLDLREVGVDGDVGGEAARQPVLEVDADVAGAVVAERRAARDRSSTVETAYGLSSRFVDRAAVLRPDQRRRRPASAPGPSRQTPPASA